jgi:integrase
MTKADALKTVIENDLANSDLDHSLSKYREHVAPNMSTPRDNVLELFNKWTHPSRMNPVPWNVEVVRNMLKSWNVRTHKELFEKFFQQKWSPSTFNVRKNILVRFYSWLVAERIVGENPFLHVVNMRRKEPRKKERTPYSDEEMVDLLEAIRTDKFSQKRSHSVYYPFLKFIFATGVRNAEAIGLQVSRVDFKRCLVTIDQSFSKVPLKSSNIKNRIMKSTKTGNSRTLPMNQEMVDLLLPLCIGKKPTDFVFTTVRKLPIGDQQFQRRVLYTVQEKLGLPKRHLYACRHTFGTIAMEKGHNAFAVAYMMGHATPKMIMECYGHLRRVPTELPDIVPGQGGKDQSAKADNRVSSEVSE